MLSIVSIATAVLVAISMMTGDSFGLLRRLRPLTTEIAAAVALTAMGGSLYLSEVANYEPCNLCWVQRAFMYPSAILLVVSLVTKNRRWAGVAGILAFVGLPVSIFHRFEQANIIEGGVCSDSTPCSSKWINEFGFITIPTMAGFGFAAIAALVGASYWLSRRDSLAS